MAPGEPSSETEAAGLVPATPGMAPMDSVTVERTARRHAGIDTR